MEQYDHKKIEDKWQKFWEEKEIYKTEDNSSKPKQYILDMFPYPSGAGLHVGHPRGYIGSDVLSRMRRMQGFNVLHPMGFDAFGLPAEQYAIQTGEHPSVITGKSIETYKKQLEIIGLSYDWSREVQTTDPAYYKWTQWIFLQLFDSYFDEKENKAKPIGELVAKFEKEDASWKDKSEKEKEDLLMNYRLAYEGYSQVNWCPELGTVLANDEIVDDENGNPVSERGGFLVEKKEMRQMFLRITKYADRLLSGLETIDWPEHIKEIQKNWIGKSEGAEIDFKVPGNSDEHSIKVFTTRPETIFGTTFLAVSAGLADKWLKMGWPAGDEIKDYVAKTLKENESADFKEKEKTGIYVGFDAINPATGENIPIWITNYVLDGVGTGAIMAVPAHDERDFDFAKKFGLGNNQVISEEDTLINSREFNGLTSQEAKSKITEFVGGKMVTKYKMRDAIFARQRYWGEPIPLRHEGDLIKSLSEKDLPLELPNVDSYKPAGNGESPLASVPEWKDAGYETNTMPGWAGSSWYFLRYMDPKNGDAFAGKDALNYWKDVDVYIGGAEHATGHLLYSRFWHKVLHDLGHVPTEEPFKLLKNQGLILASDGRKMSKRWGNVVNPDEMVDRFGADSFRLYEMFIGPFEQYTSWNTDGLVGTRRFLERVWNIGFLTNFQDSNTTNDNIENLLNKTIKKITEDIENFRFNTSVSSMMVFVNSLKDDKGNYYWISKENFKKFLQIMAPFAPHMSEELWHELGEKDSIHKSTWPTYDAEKIKDEKIKIAIQINGKVRDEIEIAQDASEEEVKSFVIERETVKEHIGEGEIKKFIYVKGKIVNIVI